LLARGLPMGTLIIGNDIFKRFKLKLNYGNNTLEMDGSGTLEYFYEKDRKYEFLNSAIKRDPYEMFYVNMIKDYGDDNPREVNSSMVRLPGGTENLVR
jgi:hypothetical protein